MKIVVLSKSYEAALGIGRSLRLANYNDIDLVFVGNNGSDIALSSNLFTSKKHIKKRDDEVVVNALIDNYGRMDSNEKSVLFSADDFTTSLIDRKCDELVKYFIFTHVDGYKSGSITQLMDKAFQMSVAPSFGLNVAETSKISFVDGNFPIPDKIIYPCIIKPEVSAEGAAKSNIKICNNDKILRDHLSCLVQKNAKNNLLIQRLIDIENEYDIHGICNGEDVYIPIAHKKQLTAIHTKGVTVIGKLIDPAELEPAISSLKELLRSFHFHGLVDVELFQSQGKTYLNEINLRAAGTCWAATNAGVNLPDLFVQTLYDDNIPIEFGNIRFGDLFVNEKTAFEEVQFGFIHYRKLRSILKKGFGLIQDQNDIMPWKVFKKSMNKRILHMKIKKFLHKS